jgi:hypothetical protein
MDPQTAREVLALYRLTRSCRRVAQTLGLPRRQVRRVILDDDPSAFLPLANRIPRSQWRRIATAARLGLSVSRIAAREDLPRSVISDVLLAAQVIPRTRSLGPEEISRMRDLRASGASISRIARETARSWPAVRRALGHPQDRAESTAT